MSSNNLAIKITADVADLQAKFAVARAETNALSLEMNKLAKASAAGTIDAAGSAKLQQLSGDLIRARTVTQGYAAELEKAGFSLNTFGRATQAAGEHSATGVRYIRELFDEISSGRTRYLPSTLAAFGQSVLHMNIAALGAVGAVAALTAGVGYLAFRSVEAKRALDQIDLGAKFAGNNIDPTIIKTLADEMAKASNVSSSAAREILAGFTSMHDTSVPQINELTAVVSDFAKVTGLNATKAGEELAKIFAGKETAVEFAKTIGAIKQAQLDAAQAADKSGNENQVFATKMDMLNMAIGRATPTIDKHNTGILSSISNMFLYSGALNAGLTAQQFQNDLLEVENTKRQRQVALLKDLGAQIRSTPASPEQTLKTGVAVAEKENPVAMQIDTAKSKVTELTAALAVAQQRGDSVDIAKLNAGLAKANEQLSALQFGPVMERMRTDMANVAATWDGTQSGMLTKQRQIATAALAQEQKGSKDYLAIQQEIARLSVQIRAGAGQEIIANAREQISEIGAATTTGTLQRLEREGAVWRQLLSGDQLTAAQRVEVQRSLNSSMSSLERERVSEARSIAQSNANTDIAISKLKIDAAKSDLELELQANRVNADQKLQILRNLTTQESQLDIQNLQNELASLTDQPVEYNRVYNQIRELKAKLVTDLGTLDKQAAADAARDARDQASQWRGMVSEIEGAESQMVNTVLNRRQSLTRTLVQLSGELVTKEIANDLRAMTTKLLLAKGEETSKKALEEGGYLYHLLVSHMGTQATITSQTAQTAATVAGNTARTTATMSAAATSRGVAAATGAKTVIADAAKAFSGTYASVAQIPYVGWLIAPAAAAGAFAAVSAYEGMASLAVGTAYVPKDMPAMLHQGEAVMPKPWAESMRKGELGDMGGSGSGETHYHTHNWNINALDGHSVTRMLSDPQNRRKFQALLSS